MTIDQCIAKRILVDTDSSANVHCKNTFLQMDILRSQETPYVEPLVGFTGQTNQSEGKISLPVNVGNTAYMVETLMISVLSPCNCILGRLVLYQLRAKIDTCDLSMEHGSKIHVIYGDHKAA